MAKIEINIRSESGLLIEILDFTTSENIAANINWLWETLEKIKKEEEADGEK